MIIDFRNVPQGGGSGSGSTVQWNQILTEGTKIAEVTIDGTRHNVYSADAEGPQGPQGAQGIQGAQGPQGAKGDRGNDGAAYTLPNAGNYDIPVYISSNTPKPCAMTSASNRWGIIPHVRTNDGVMDIGKYIDFYPDNSGENQRLSWHRIYTEAGKEALYYTHKSNDLSVPTVTTTGNLNYVPISQSIAKIVCLTQAQYNALSSKNARTLYIITG